MKSFKKVFAIITCMCMLFNFSSFASEKTEGVKENENLKESKGIVWHLKDGDEDYKGIKALSEDSESELKKVLVESKILSKGNAEYIDVSVGLYGYDAEGKCVFNGIYRPNYSVLPIDEIWWFEFNTLNNSNGIPDGEIILEKSILNADDSSL